MSRGLGLRLAPFAGALVLAMSSASARAGSADMTKTACIDANTKGQDLRRDARLTAALDQFLACASASCPAILRDDCTRRVDEVERALPTIVFDAKDASGQDVSAVQVTVDGKLAADRLAGAPLTVDPGEHVFAFQVEGRPPVTRTLVLKEGERDRRERIVVDTAPMPSASPPPPSSAPPAIAVVPAAAMVAPSVESSNVVAPREGGMGTRKILAITAAGVGVAGVAIGAVFGLMTFAKAGDQKADCAGVADCNNRAQALSDHSSATTDGAIATAGFAVGGALLATGAFLFFFAPNHPSAAPSGSGLWLTPSLGPAGAGAWLTGRF